MKNIHPNAVVRYGETMHKPLPVGTLRVRIEYRMAGAIGAFEHTYRTIQVTAGMTWEDVSKNLRREFPYDKYEHVLVMPPFGLRILA